MAINIRWRLNTAGSENISFPKGGLNQSLINQSWIVQSRIEVILDWCFRRILLSETQSAEWSTSGHLLLWFNFLIAHCVGLGQGFIFVIPRRCILFCTSSHSKSNVNNTVLIFPWCLIWTDSIKDRRRYLLLCSYIEKLSFIQQVIKHVYSVLRTCFAYTVLSTRITYLFGHPEIVWTHIKILKVCCCFALLHWQCSEVLLIVVVLSTSDGFWVCGYELCSILKNMNFI